jgi:hypothetical protein
LNQAVRTFNDKIWVYVGNSIQEVGARFLGDISRESPMLVMEPFYQVHGSALPMDAAGVAFHLFLADRYVQCHQIYSSGIVKALLLAIACGLSALWARAGVCCGPIAPGAKPCPKSLQGSCTGRGARRVRSTETPFLQK